MYLSGWHWPILWDRDREFNHSTRPYSRVNSKYRWERIVKTDFGLKVIIEKTLFHVLKVNMWSAYVIGICDPSWNFLDFYSLKSAFQGFWVIQTGLQLLLLKTYLLWKKWPIYIKRWKPVWIRACLVSWKQQNYYYDTSGEEKTLGKGYQCTAEYKI